MSMAGKNYGDSIKCLSDYIKKSNPSAEVVWAFDDNYYSKVACEDKNVKLYSFKYYYHMLTSHFFLTNQQCRNIMFRKRRGQVKVQTWHGIALKRIGKDISPTENRGGIVKKLTPNKNKNELRDTDIFIAGSQYMKDVLWSAFGWQNVHVTGTPRNDIFFHKNDAKEKVYAYYRIKNKKTILYAPTFRSGGDMSYYDIDLEKVKQYYEEKELCEYAVLVRLHPNIMSLMSHFSNIQSVDFINATLYPDVQELLCAADVLVTDYSSVMFDFMYSYKPVILYVPDRKVYNRGFYLNIDDLPFLVVNNNLELLKVLATFDEEKYKEEINAFLIRIGSVEDGHATERVCNLIVSWSAEY